jgi:small redox-active disulfide protein 2
MNTIKLEILGTGCKKCQQLEANVKEAVAALNLEAEIFHITDPLAIADRGVLKTPALVINDSVASQGKILTPDEIKLRLNS